MNISAYDLAQRYVGVKEVAGTQSNPLVLAMLQLDQAWPKSDAVAWCSAFVNWIAWHLRLPRSKGLNARSWLNVGLPIDLADAKPGFDIVVFNRGGVPEPVEITVDANGNKTYQPGHVAFFAKLDGDFVQVLGGNQGDSVGLARFQKSGVLGVRRLAA